MGQTDRQTDGRTDRRIALQPINTARQDATRRVESRLAESEINRRLRLRECENIQSHVYIH